MNLAKARAFATYFATFVTFMTYFVTYATYAAACAARLAAEGLRLRPGVYA